MSMAKAYMYILRCANGNYYTGSTKYLDFRMRQHWSGEGANYTRKYPPDELVYVEEFERIDHAFFREKQVQGWSRKKKEALLEGRFESLSALSVAYRDKTEYDQFALPNKDNDQSENGH
jgi:putative endonuclease